MSFLARLQRLLLFLPLLAAAAAAQQTHRVPADLPTIQAAIDASASGDTVLVSPGTYFEHLTISGKELALTSSGTSSNTFLDGSSTGTVITIANTPSLRTTVSGFTIQHGAATSTPSLGAGLHLARAGATVTHNVFARNSGANVLVDSGAINLLDNSISTAPVTGCPPVPQPGLFSTVNSSTGIQVNSAYINTPNLGVGALLSTIVGNSIFGDGTVCSGLGVDLQAIGGQTPAILLWNNTLRNNHTAVRNYETDSVTLFQNLIYDNADGAYLEESIAGGIPASTTHLVNNTIVNNLTSIDPAFGISSDITLIGSFGRVELIDNIVVGTTTHAILACKANNPNPDPNFPVVLDHNDIFNTTHAAGGLVDPACFSAIGSDATVLLASNGNLSADPQLTGSTDLHPLPGSPVLDAGTNSAPRLVLPPAAPDPSLTSLLTQDIAGNPRIANFTGRSAAIVDLGAYERPGTPPLQPAALDLAPADGNFRPYLNSETIKATVRIAPGANPPIGNVTFFANGVSIGTVPVDPSAGTATLPFTFPYPGWYTLTATFDDPFADGPATSVVRYVNYSPIATTTANTTLTLSATPSTQTLNQPITLTAHLGSTTASNSPGPVPPGALSLSQDGTYLSSLQPDSTGTATYTVPSPGVGAHTWTVTYAGTASYTAATASTQATVNAPATTSISASISPTPASENSPVTLAATITATSGTSTPTGSLTFTDGATTLATLPLTAGSASFTTSTLALGTHTITFTYTPDPAFSPTATTRTVTVGGQTTVTTLSVTPNPSPLTTSPVLSASVRYTAASTSLPTGTLSIYDGPTLLYSTPYPLNNGNISFAQTFTTSGVHHLSAVFTPATTADLTSSAATDLTLTAAPALVTTLTLSPTSITLGNSFTLATSIAPAAALPPGSTLSLLDNGVLRSTTVLSTGASTNSITFTGPGTPIGSHQFYETLISPQGTLVSTSNTVTLQVSPAPVTLSLAASPATALAPVTLTAYLASPSIYSNIVPSGSVTFLDGSTPLGTATLASTTGPFSGAATLVLPFLSPGSHTLSASYTGNAQLPPATAPSITELIIPAPTITTFTVSPSSTTGAFTTITLAAHVRAATVAAALNSSACNGPCPPPFVDFLLNGPTPIAQAVIDPSGNATATVHLPAGNANFVAFFAGNAFFGSSGTYIESRTITPNPSALTLASTATTVQQNTAVTLAALLTPGVTFPGTHPTGTITLSDSLGTTTSTPLVSPAGQLTGSATLTLTPTAVGTHTLTATYSGDTNNLPATATLTLVVTTPPTPVAPTQDFHITLSTSALTLQTTHHTSMQVTITTTGGLSDTIHLSCAYLPVNASCTFSPATLRVGQNTTANPAAATYTSTVAVDTDFILNWAHTTAPARPRSTNPALPLLALTLPATLLALRKNRRRLPHLLALLLLTAAATLPLTACGNKQPGHTDPGNYTIQVTGHADTLSADRSSPFTLTVTP